METKKEIFKQYTFIGLAFLVGVFALAIMLISPNAKADNDSAVDALRCRADINNNGHITTLDLASIAYDIAHNLYNLDHDLNRDEKVDYGDAHIAFSFWDEYPINCQTDNDKLGSADWVTAAMSCRSELSSDQVVNSDDVYEVGRHSMKYNGMYDIDKSGQVNKDDAYLVRGYEYASLLHC